MGLREDLELAAKAVGLAVVGWNDGGEPYSSGPGLILENGAIWNPRASSGQALELLAALGISLMPYPIYKQDCRNSIVAKQRRSGDLLRESNPTEVVEVYGEDLVAAWRLVITRAAAEIGRGEP